MANAALDSPIDKNSNIVSGALYEIIVTVKGKFDVKNVNNVIRAVRFGEGLVDKSPFTKLTGYWTITDIVAESDVWKNVVPYTNTGPSEMYRLRIQAIKTSEHTPVVVAVGVILALLIVFVGIVSWNAYRIRDLSDHVLNPLVIVGAVVFAALIWGGK